MTNQTNQPRINSRQKRKLQQIDNWANSIYGSWQNWKSQLYMQGKSIKTK